MEQEVEDSGEEDGEKDEINEPKNMMRYNLVDQNPQHVVKEFGNGVVVRSDFDSGNLRQVYQVSDNEYEMLVSSDGLPYSFDSKMHTTFHFKISGVSLKGNNKAIKFTILNLNNV